MTAAKPCSILYTNYKKKFLNKLKIIESYGTECLCIKYGFVYDSRYPKWQISEIFKQVILNNM
jgi:hypothetical protein